MKKEISLIYIGFRILILSQTTINSSSQFNPLNSKDDIRRIARNTIILIFGEIARTAFSFLFFTFIARYLGAAGFGILSFAIAFTTIFSVFADLGLVMLTIREVARNRGLADKYLGNIISMKMVLSLIVLGLIALLINVLGYPEQTKQVVYLIGLSVIIDGITIAFYSIFQANERMEFVTIGRVLNSILLFVSAIFAIRQELSVIAIAGVWLAANLLILVYSAWLTHWKFTRLRIEIDLAFWKGIFKQSWPFGLAIIFSNIYYWISTVIVSYYHGDEAAGWYSAAYRFVLVLLLISDAYYKSIYPVMARFYTSSKLSLKAVYLKSVKYMLILVLPIAVGGTLLSGKIVDIIYGVEYTQSVIILQILIWSLVSMFVSGVYAQLFFSLNKQLTIAKITCVCAIINIILNIILIPRFSGIGAGITAVVTEFISLCLVFILSYKFGYGIPLKGFITVLARVLMASGVMGVIVFFLRDMTLWGLIPLSVVIYFIILFFIRGIDKDDIVIIRQAITSVEKKHE